jgi:phenylacetate-CoA ligase
VLETATKPAAKPHGTAQALSHLLQSQKPKIKRTAAVVPVSWRQSPRYWDWRQFLERAQFWPHEQIEAWQLNRLQSLVRHAYVNTPGYRELYRQAGVRPDDIRSLPDLQRLPFTTKELFRDHLEEFSVRRRGRRYVTTGGSTGIPFGFYLARGNEAIEQAFIHTLWNRVGWRLGSVNAVLRGGYVGSAEKPWHFDAYRQALNLSSYHLTPETLPVCLEALRHWDVRILQAYPSSLHLLSSLMNDAGQAGTIPLDLILLGSENVYDWQLDLFQQVFPKAKLFAWYGHAEKAILAPWCERCRRYHAWPFYGITEVLHDDGKSAAEGIEGELVGTSLLNFVTPFIRYRTMDLAVPGPSACSACGRQFQLLERITGRAHEVIVTGTGRHISMTAINMHDRSFDDLRQFQFFQDTPGKVAFKYVPKAPLSPAQVEQLRQILAPKLGPDTELTLTAVSEIPRTKSGKYRFLDQRLDIKYGDR